MSVQKSIGVIVRPHSADEVSKYARRALRVADAVGQLPTPIDDLLAAADDRKLEDRRRSQAEFCRPTQGCSKARVQFDCGKRFVALLIFESA